MNRCYQEPVAAKQTHQMHKVCERKVYLDLVNQYGCLKCANELLRCPQPPQPQCSDVTTLGFQQGEPHSPNARDSNK